MRKGNNRWPSQYNTKQTRRMLGLYMYDTSPSETGHTLVSCRAADTGQTPAKTNQTTKYPDRTRPDRPDRAAHPHEPNETKQRRETGRKRERKRKRRMIHRASNNEVTQNETTYTIASAATSSSPAVRVNHVPHPHPPAPICAQHPVGVRHPRPW